MLQLGSKPVCRCLCFRQRCLPRHCLPLLSADAVYTVAAATTAALHCHRHHRCLFFAAITTSSLFSPPTAYVSAAPPLTLFSLPPHRCLCFRRRLRHCFRHSRRHHHHRKDLTCRSIGASGGRWQRTPWPWPSRWGEEVYFMKFLYQKN